MIVSYLIFKQSIKGYANADLHVQSSSCTCKLPASCVPELGDLALPDAPASEYVAPERCFSFAPSSVAVVELLAGGLGIHLKIHIRLFAPSDVVDP